MPLELFEKFRSLCFTLKSPPMMTLLNLLKMQFKSVKKKLDLGGA